MEKKNMLDVWSITREEVITDDLDFTSESFRMDLDVHSVALIGLVSTTWLCKPSEWLACNSSLNHHPWIKHSGQEIKWNDDQLKKLMIMLFVIQILLVSASGIVKRAFWRICIPILVYNQHLEYNRNRKGLLELLQTCFLLKANWASLQSLYLYIANHKFNSQRGTQNLARLIPPFSRTNPFLNPSGYKCNLFICATFYCKCTFHRKVTLL